MFLEKKHGTTEIIDEKRFQKIKAYACHLCRNCSIEITECPKLWDIEKRNINEYGFIKAGIQELDKDGGSEYLAVIQCEKYFHKEEQIFYQDKRIKKYRAKKPRNNRDRIDYPVDTVEQIIDKLLEKQKQQEDREAKRRNAQ